MVSLERGGGPAKLTLLASKLRRAVCFVAALLLLPIAACQKPYLATEADYVYFNSANPTTTSVDPVSEAVAADITPRTLLDPGGREKWNLTLAEAVQLAIENNKDIAVTSWYPGIQGTDIDYQLATFDAVLDLGFAAARIDEQQNFSLTQVLSDQEVILQDLTGQSAGQNNLVSISKMNATGGTSKFSYGFDGEYTKPSTGELFNPAYQSYASVAFAQPLLRGAGVEYNRAPTLIARADYEGSIADFYTQVADSLLQVESSYWNLVAAYEILEAYDTALRVSLQTWQGEFERQMTKIGTKADSKQSLANFAQFRLERARAVQTVLNAETDLRQAMGIAPEDLRQIVPIDSPAKAQYTPDWQIGVHEAIAMRPEIISRRFAVRSAELVVVQSRNEVLPDVKVGGQYELTGLSEDFNESFETMAGNQYQNWYLYATLSTPIGNRAAHAQLRRARLELSYEQARLRQTEYDILIDLKLAYRGVVEQYEIMNLAQYQVQANVESLQALFESYRQGQTTLFNLLSAQVSLANARITQAGTVRDYNVALANWEYTKGTLIRNDNIAVLEGGLGPLSPKLARQRQWQLTHSPSLPLPAGKRVHGADPCPNLPPPLFPLAEPQGPLSPSADWQPADGQADSQPAEGSTGSHPIDASADKNDPPPSLKTEVPSTVPAEELLDTAIPSPPARTQQPPSNDASGR